MRRRLAAITGLLTLVASMSLAACGGRDATPEPTPHSTATSTPTAEPTSTAAWPVVTQGTITTEDLNVRVGPGRQYEVLGRLQPDDEIPVAAFLADGQWLAVPGIGWVTYNAQWVELDMDPLNVPVIDATEPLFEFAGPVYAADERTDIPLVDTILDAVVNGDGTAVASLGKTPEHGDPNDAPKTAATSLCTSAVLPGDQLADHIDEFMTSEVVPDAGGLRLYAVVGAPGQNAGGGNEGVDARFDVVLGFEGGEGRRVWLAADGSGIEWFTLGCEPTPPGALLREGTNTEAFFWVRPVAPEPLDALQ